MTKTLSRTRLACSLASAALLALVSAGSAQAQDLAPLLPDDVLVSTTSSPLGPVSAAFDGSRYLVVWAQEPEGGGAPSVFGRFVDAAGGLSGEPFQISQFPIDELEPAVTFSGSEYLVVWRDMFGVKARVVRTDATLGAVILLVSEPNHQKLEPAVASDGSEFLVVWRDSRNILVDFSDIRGQFVVVDAAGNPSYRGFNLLVSPVVGHQIAPAIAFGADGLGSEGYLVTWTHDVDETAGEFDVFGAVVDPSGGVTAPIPIATGAGPQGTPEPAEIAFDGSNFLVAFHDGSDGRLYGARVSAAGALLDDPGFVIAETCAWSATVPCANDVAFGDGEYLVTWDDGARIQGARVSPAGAVLDPTPIGLSLDDVEQRLPAAAFGVDSYLVTWEVTGTADKYAQLVGPTAPATPAEAIEDLTESVEALIDGGVLEGGAGRVALRALEIAALRVDQDRPRAAIRALRVFNFWVRLLDFFDVIPGEDAEMLLDSSNAIIDQLSG